MKRPHPASAAATLAIIAVLFFFTRGTNGVTLAAVPDEQQVARLTSQAQALVRDGDNETALALLDRILLLDPHNDYARGLRPLLVDRENSSRDRTIRRDIARNPQPTPLQLELKNAQVEWEAKGIPYEDVVICPPCWPDFPTIRVSTAPAALATDGKGGTTQGLTLVGLLDPMGRTVPKEKREGSHFGKMSAQMVLSHRIPEIRFDGNQLADVIEFLSDVGGVNIFVNWPALEAASVARDAPVNENIRDMKFSKALSLILNDVGGRNVRLGYAIDRFKVSDNGGGDVIVISTRDDLVKTYGTAAVVPATRPAIGK